jgi:hypothetical protein
MLPMGRNPPLYPWRMADYAMLARLRAVRSRLNEPNDIHCDIRVACRRHIPGTRIRRLNHRACLRDKPPLAPPRGSHAFTRLYDDLPALLFHRHSRSGNRCRLACLRAGRWPRNCERLGRPDLAAERVLCARRGRRSSASASVRSNGPNIPASAPARTIPSRSAASRKRAWCCSLRPGGTASKPTRSSSIFQRNYLKGN